VGICSIMEVLGAFRMDRLVLFFILGGRYGLQIWLVAPFSWSLSLWLVEGGLLGWVVAVAFGRFFK